MNREDLDNADEFLGMLDCHGYGVLLHGQVELPSGTTLTVEHDGETGRHFITELLS